MTVKYSAERIQEYISSLVIKYLFFTRYKWNVKAHQCCGMPTLHVLFEEEDFCEWNVQISSLTSEAVVLNVCVFNLVIPYKSRSQWPRVLRRRSSAARLLRLWIRIQPGAWMFFCCECCVLSGRGLCDELITRPEESYRMWRVVVCHQETSKTRRLKPASGLWKYNRNGL
jgi:hypothetical protein